MERKNFLQQGMIALGSAFILPLAKSCSKSDISYTGSGTDTTTTNTTTTTTGSCTTTPTETEGPFPTKTPSSLVQADIVGDRTGVSLAINITITNKNNNCSALSNAIVDIWHCDAAGNYSEYGGSGMQSTNYQSVHWLRGRQSTNTNGLVTFKSIFPGWYSGRAPHIHVHVYNASGKSLLVTQIAFPTDICNTIYTTASPYKSRGTQDTQNSNDNVFSDSLTYELGTVTGSVASGYVLAHTINVNG